MINENFIWQAPYPDAQISYLYLELCGEKVNMDYVFTFCGGFIAGILFLSWAMVEVGRKKDYMMVDGKMKWIDRTKRIIKEGDERAERLMRAFDKIKNSHSPFKKE